MGILIHMLSLYMSLNVLALFSVLAAEGCPAGWMGTDGGDFCYLVSRDTMNWYSAQEFCWENGGYLAEFFSSEEEARVDDILATDLDYWIGLTDSASEGVWKWQESRVEAEYVNWDQGEPNNNGGEDCVEKGSRYSELWNDRPCDS